MSEYVRVHRPLTLNHAGRRALGIGKGEAMLKRQARAAAKRERHEQRLARRKRERKQAA